MFKNTVPTDAINASIIENYTLLTDSGILQYIEHLNRNIVDKDELLDEAVEIFNKNTVMDLIHYITKKFLNKFIPETLTFVIQDDTDPNKPNIIIFENMKQTSKSIKSINFLLFKEFFSLSPTSITFDAFEVMIDSRKDTDVFSFLKPELLVPMMGLEGVYGFIILGKKVLVKPFEQEEINYIDQVMKFASISLQNIIHYHRAILDLKTNLYNHDFFTRQLKQELSRVSRYNSQFSLLMIDIDHFKHINDTYGHVAGDKIIKLLSQTITASLRTEDIPARFGGEEFIIMLVECRKEYALSVAERIRKKIESFVIKYEGHTFRMSISIGVLHVSKDNVEDPSDILEKVDAALYYSKEHGRNKCTMYTSKISHNK